MSDHELTPFIRELRELCKKHGVEMGGGGGPRGEYLELRVGFRKKLSKSEQANYERVAVKATESDPSKELGHNNQTASSSGDCCATSKANTCPESTPEWV